LRFKIPELLFMPEATKGHLKTARKEMLLALRSLLDRAIEQTEGVGKKKKRTKIDVQ